MHIDFQQGRIYAPLEHAEFLYGFARIVESDAELIRFVKRYGYRSDLN